MLYKIIFFPQLSCAVVNQNLIKHLKKTSCTLISKPPLYIPITIEPIMQFQIVLDLYYGGHSFKVSGS